MAPVPGWLVMASVTELLELVTVLPPASWTVTTGWVVHVGAFGSAAGLGGEGEPGSRADGDVEGGRRGPGQAGGRGGQGVVAVTGRGSGSRRRWLHRLRRFGLVVQVSVTPARLGCR